MPSVKRMRAIWYHGINENHGIFPDDPFKLEHIIAMICYTHETELCTAFRGTYRRNNKEEHMTSQKERHSNFAWFGKLLYESFVFYASKSSKVQTLHHG
eukprot:850414_1